MSNFEFFMVLWLLLTIRADQCEVRGTSKEHLFVWKCLAIGGIFIMRWAVN